MDIYHALNLNAFDKEKEAEEEEKYLKIVIERMWLASSSEESCTQIILEEGQIFANEH